MVDIHEQPLFQKPYIKYAEIPEGPVPGRIGKFSAWGPKAVSGKEWIVGVMMSLSAPSLWAGPPTPGDLEPTWEFPPPRRILAGFHGLLLRQALLTRALPRSIAPAASTLVRSPLTSPPSLSSPGVQPAAHTEPLPTSHWPSSVFSTQRASSSRKPSLLSVPGWGLCSE